MGGGTVVLAQLVLDGSGRPGESTGRGEVASSSDGSVDTIPLYLLLIPLVVVAQLVLRVLRLKHRSLESPRRARDAIHTRGYRTTRRPVIVRIVVARSATRLGRRGRGEVELGVLELVVLASMVPLDVLPEGTLPAEVLTTSWRAALVRTLARVDPPMSTFNPSASTLTPHSPNVVTHLARELESEKAFVHPSYTH